MTDWKTLALRLDTLVVFRGLLQREVLSAFWPKAGRSPQSLVPAWSRS